MSLQAALDCIKALKAEKEQSREFSDVAEVVKWATTRDFDFCESELRRAHALDWAMRWKREERRKQHR